MMRRNTRRKQSVRISLLCPATWLKKLHRSLAFTTGPKCLSMTNTMASLPPDLDLWLTVRISKLKHCPLWSRPLYSIQFVSFFCCSHFRSTRIVHATNTLSLACKCHLARGSTWSIHSWHHHQQHKWAPQNCVHIYIRNHKSGMGETGWYHF